MSALPDRLLFGAAYYPEYHPDIDVATDLDLMAAASFTVIRVGESVWSTWEPRDGVFDLEWLAPTLDGAHERGIAVILGTPTYAVPPWLARRYPEIAGERGSGVRIGWGARQEVDISHAAFQFHAERVIRRIVERYAGHPAVIGFQVDNEPGLHLLHNHGVFQRFVDELREEYGDVETLNRDWGLAYWSHRLSTWDDLWRPDGNAQPQYDLAWRRVQARLVTEFIAWQADIVREYARPDQFVTTCLSYERPAAQDDALTAALDVTAGNPYYAMQDHLMLPAPARPPQGQPWATASTAGLYASADRMFASRQERFLVTETDAQTIGHAWINRPAYDGQWRAAAWALIARGASMVEYWQWRTLHEGAETYWGGVIPHSGRPGRAYREIAALGRDLAQAGELVAASTPDHDVTFVYSHASRWALHHQSPLALAGDEPDRASYTRLLAAFTRGAFDAGLQSRLVHERHLAGPDPDRPWTPADLVAAHPVLVAVGLYAVADATLDRLVAYAQAGGHLVVGPRTGYADEQARARHDVAPGRLAGPAGAWYEEFSNLDDDLPVTLPQDSPLTATASARATAWADGLLLDPTDAAGGAHVVVGYDHPHFGRFAAVTTRAVGSGRITVVGTVPNPALAQSLFAWLVPDPLSDPHWRAGSPSVTATSASLPDGRRLRFLHNWSWTPARVRVPVAVRDVLHEADLPLAAEVPLGPWDVAVLLVSGAAG